MNYSVIDAFYHIFPKSTLIYEMGKLYINQTLALRVSLKIKLSISWKTPVAITVNI